MAEIVFYNQFQLSSQLLWDVVRCRSSLIITGQVLSGYAQGYELFWNLFFLIKQSIHFKKYQWKIPVLQFHICEVPRNFFLSLLRLLYVASDHQVADFPFFLCILILVTASPFLPPNQLCELDWEQVMYGVRCRTVSLYMQKKWKGSWECPQTFNVLTSLAKGPLLFLVYWSAVNWP